MASGIYHGVYHGAIRGPAHNASIYGGVMVDGPGEVQTPQTLTQWRQADTYIPGFYFRAQDASGDLVDDVQGIQEFVASGTPEYEQALPGWESKFIKISETATEGFVVPAAADDGLLFNTDTQSVTMTFLFQLETLPGALRVLAAISGANGYASINGSGILQLRNSLAATGAYDYDDDAVHFIRIGYDRRNQVYKCWTDKEVLTGTWEALPDGIKGIGGCGAFTPPPFWFNNVEISVGSDAEALIAGNAADMAARGWELDY
jgi:hypothetical protein